MPVVPGVSMSQLPFLTCIFIFAFSTANCYLMNETAQNVTYRNCFNCSNFLGRNETEFQPCSDNTTCVGNVCFVVLANEQLPLLYFAGCLNVSTSIDFGVHHGLCNKGENETECVCNSKDSCNAWQLRGLLESQNATFVGIDFDLANKTFFFTASQLAEGEAVNGGQNQRNINALGAAAATPISPISSSAECYRADKLTTAVILLIFAVLHLV